MAGIGRVAPPKVTGLRRYALNNWRIRTRLVALLVLPVIAAIVLGGLRIQTSLLGAQQLSKVSQLSAVAQAATSLADALENERDASAGPLTATHDQTDSTVVAARGVTDTALNQFTKIVNNLDTASLPGGGTDITNVQQQLQNLNSIRGDDTLFPKGDNSVIQQSISEYDYPIVSLIQLSQDLALGSSDSTLISASRALEQFSLAKDYVSIQRAMLAAALASPNQVLSGNDTTFLKRAVSQYTSTIGAFTAVIGSQQANAMITPWSHNTNILSAKAYVASVTASASNGIKNSQTVLSSQTWFDTASSQIVAMTSDQENLVQLLGHQAADLKSQAQTDTIINSVLIALVLIVAVGGAALVGRSMVRTLRKLQETAEDVAEHRLPELVRTLSEADPQDVDISIEPIGINTSDEIGHVAHAFDLVYNEAVRLAAEQALLRGNINAMFTNLSRRSQGLIQRQLSLISELESREADPDQLASLFKLDHLATRMRRNGENLLVLSGEDPGRRWTRPVPLVDVLRAAASEVEQYERIELASVPTADVIGRVVNDLVHLLAELLENATSFSSPQTRVRVTGHALPDGRVLVEIHDTGIGLSPDDLADINERLANPPVVDVSVSRRMGLFVVGRLSLRHGIRIQLRPSDSGGTTALVMLPVEITNAAEKRGKQGPRGGEQSPQGPGAAALQGGPGQPAIPGGGRPGGPGSQGNGPLGLPGQPGQFGQSGLAGVGSGGEPNGFGKSGGPRPQLDAAGQAPFPAPGSPQGSPQPGLPTRSGLPQRDPSQSDLPTRDRSSRDLPSRDVPSRDLPQRDLPQRDLPSRDLPKRGLPQRGAPEPAFNESNPWDEPAQHAAAGPDPRDPANASGPAGPSGFDSPAAPPQQQLPGGLRGARYPDPNGQDRPLPTRPQQGNPAAPQPASALDGRNGSDALDTRNSRDGSGGNAGNDGPGTMQFARPRFDEPPTALPPVAAPQPPMVPTPAPAPMPEPEPDPLTGPLALPPAGTSPERSPIFEAMESNWFRAGRADRMRAVQVTDKAKPEAAQPTAPASPMPPAPAQPDPVGATASGTAGWRPAGDNQAAVPPWRPSANDERWRQAEAAREPTSSGTTSSGLPRRVPQANLVAGTAESAPMAGPQVSRTPEEVRGRLTNLRRGVQQGRRAGQDGQGPYGTDSQER